MPLFGKKDKETEAHCIKCGAELPKDASYCTVCGSTQNPTPSHPHEFEIADWRKAVTIKNGEYVIVESNLDDCTAFEIADMTNMKYGFVLTNQRLITLRFKYGEERDGKTVVSFELHKEFPLESIKDVTYHNKEIAIYTDEGKYDCGDTWDVTGLAYPKSADDIARFNYFRKKVIEQKEKRAIVTLDFSSLKSLMEKGGIVLTTLTCPKCNAPLRIPTDGTETVCQHCGSTVYAQDILKKLKTLLS